ncbi:unnamed protein product, partial [Trichogramma brassicae]
MRMVPIPVASTRTERLALHRLIHIRKHTIRNFLGKFFKSVDGRNELRCRSIAKDNLGRPDRAPCAWAVARFQRLRR